MKTDPRVDFDGAKAILLCRDMLVVLRRDDVPHIPFPNRIDLPGGGREGEETPEACAARETLEEVGLRIDPARFHWARTTMGNAGITIWLVAAEIDATEAEGLVLGDEGQACWMLPIAEFLESNEAISHLQGGLRAYLDWRSRRD